MDQMAAANIALDVVSIILSLLPVVYLLGNHRYRQERSNRYFLGVCVSNLLMIVGDLPDWLIQDASGPLRKIVLTLSSALFYTASAFVLYFFGRYILEYLQVAGRTGKRYLAAITAVCGVQIFFALISPLFWSTSSLNMNYCSSGRRRSWQSSAST